MSCPQRPKDLPLGPTSEKFSPAVNRARVDPNHSRKTLFTYRRLLDPRSSLYLVVLFMGWKSQAEDGEDRVMS